MSFSLNPLLHKDKKRSKCTRKQSQGKVDRAQLAHRGNSVRCFCRCCILRVHSAG